MSIRNSVFPFLAFRAHAATLAALALAGCAAPNPPPSTAPLAFDRSEHDRQTGLLGAAPPQLPATTPMSATPVVPPDVTDNVRATAPTPIDAAGAGNLSVSIEQMPLPSFIQAIYGGILKLNYSVDSAVASRQDLITFRTPRPLSAAKLAELSALLLKSYGVAVQDFGGVLRIVPAASTAATVPQIRRGRALPTVPQALRPVFQYIEFEAIRAASALPSIRKIVGERVQLQEDGMNGVLITGQSDDVQIALDLVRIFDQPSMRGQRSVRITPRFWGAEEFARRLTEVLRAEGYVAANQVDPTAPIIVLPMAAINSVLVFAQRDDILRHVQAWAQELDQVSQVQQGGSMFTYPVKNSDAAELARSLNELIGGGDGSSAVQATGAAGATAAAGTPGTAAASANVGRRRGVVVNNATNTLIFQGGTQEEYRQWLGLLTELDKPVKSALIDVVVAEVSFDSANQLGFAWQLDQLSSQSGLKLSGTIYDIGLGGAGAKINALLGGNPLRQLAINALSQDKGSRVISSPKVMARNGETATITVGDDIPTVSSQAVTQGSSLIGGNSTVVPQSVQYRSTGTILRVKPVIHAGDRIDLDISQEVSSATPTDTGVTTSPTIKNRRVETKLTMRDGATVMLGGLIGETTDRVDAGVPYLKDIPVLGSMFKNATRNKSRTELVILITPYILNDSFDAETVTDTFQNSLSDWMQSVRPRVGPRPPGAPLPPAALQRRTESPPASGAAEGSEPMEAAPAPAPGPATNAASEPPVGKTPAAPPTTDEPASAS